MICLDETATCTCGKVKWCVKGDVFMNAICHCRACSIMHGQDSVHILVVKESILNITAGQECVKEFKGLGTISCARCTECACPIYQASKGKGIRATFPRMFDCYGADNKSPMMKPEHCPTSHVNYENRCIDSCDNLVKYKCFPPMNILTN